MVFLLQLRIMPLIPIEDVQEELIDTIIYNSMIEDEPEPPSRQTSVVSTPKKIIKRIPERKKLSVKGIRMRFPTLRVGTIIECWWGKKQGWHTCTIRTLSTIEQGWLITVREFPEIAAFQISKNAFNNTWRKKTINKL